MLKSRLVRPADNTQKSRLVGYARVSTADQSLGLQIDALKNAGVLEDNIHTEKISGVALKRPGLKAALLDAVEGDTFVVWKLDRFGRSLIDLLTQIETLERRGVKFRSLTEGIDTTTPAGRLLLGVLGVLAQFERDLIAERTRAGMARRKAEGATFGAPPKVDLKKAREMFRKGMSVEAVAAAFKCSKQALYNYFDAPTIWLMQGRNPRDYPRDVSKEKWVAAKIAAKKK